MSLKLIYTHRKKKHNSNYIRKNKNKNIIALATLPLHDKIYLSLQNTFSQIFEKSVKSFGSCNQFFRFQKGRLKKSSKSLIIQIDVKDRFQMSEKRLKAHAMWATSYHLQPSTFIPYYTLSNTAPPLIHATGKWQVPRHGTYHGGNTGNTGNTSIQQPKLTRKTETIICISCEGMLVKQGRPISSIIRHYSRSSLLSQELYTICLAYDRQAKLRIEVRVLWVNSGFIIQWTRQKCI